MAAISNSYEIVILGAGMVGLSLATQLLKRGISKNILVIDKEKSIGMHSSGRNSGVLHAGLYYPPNSLKAKVCVSGSIRLKNWILENGLQINNCGKVIIPQKVSLDSQLDLLAQRGRTNGAIVEFWDNQKLKENFPQLKSLTGRALWSPNTAVVKPKEIIERLQINLENSGVKTLASFTDYELDIKRKIIKKNNGDLINFDYLFNCCGMNAIKIAKKCYVGNQYKVIPFKGIYWKLNGINLTNFNTNIYPVPDLKMPFLGVHFTPSFSKNSNIVEDVFIGPTATLAFGKENYHGLDNLEPLNFISNAVELSKLFINNKGGIRKYVKEQLFLSLKPLLVRSAKELLSTINDVNIKNCMKVGIRSQLFDINNNCLVNDFLCINGKDSTHVLNAVSPAFTASFELADLIINQSPIYSSGESSLT